MLNSKTIAIVIIITFVDFSLSSRRLLQLVPNLGGNPNQLPVIPFNPNLQFPQFPQLQPAAVTGYWQQQCALPTANMACQQVGQILTDQGTGMVECSVPFSCCVCQQVYCGYHISGRYCDAIKVGAPNALYGVKQVAIKGQVMGSGAVMDCGGRGSCAGTYVIGEWVNTMICGGPDACRDSTFVFSQSKGLKCGTRSCIGATFEFNSNRGGMISCSAPEACIDASITVNGNIQDIACGGTRACKGASITVTNPMEHFQLTCGGMASCEGLSVDLIITGPAATTGCAWAAAAGLHYIEWKGITCGSLGSCLGLKLNVINNGCRPVRIEDFICIAGQSCTGSNFNFNAGASPYPLALQNCACGPSCRQASGVDLCFHNVHVLECLDPSSCSNQQRMLTNIANGFILICPNPGSCYNFRLALQIAGGSQNLITRISGFDCSGAAACNNLLVEIQNLQIGPAMTPVEISIGAVVCAQSGSCDGATFIIGPYSTIDNFICALPDSCNNCFIKRSRDDPNPVSCNQVAGNNQISATTTPAPVTPAPVTPSPVTPAPITPAPITPAPITPAPITPAPVTPVTPASITPAPVTPAPVTPVTPAPVTPSPVTPITPAPVTPAPIPPIPVIPDIPPIPGVVGNPRATSSTSTPAPVTPAPITPAPVTPVTPAPITPAPVTPAPIHPEDLLPADLQQLQTGGVVPPILPQGQPQFIPDLPLPPPAVGPNTNTNTGNVPAVIAPPIDNPQTGGAPAPPKVDPVNVDPLTNPVPPVVQTGGNPVSV